MPGTVSVRMGYEKQIFTGTAGVTATDRIENCTDIKTNFSPSFGDTTVRGDGSAPPTKTQQMTARDVKVSFGMKNDPSDVQLAAIRAVAKSADPVLAFVIKERNAAGVEVTILDGDFNVQLDEDAPMEKEETFQIELTASRKYGRLPVF